MRLVIFPRGLTYSAPSDRLGHSIDDLITCPTAARERLSHPVYKTLGPSNRLGLLQEELSLAEAAQLLEKRIRIEGVKTGQVTA